MVHTDNIVFLEEIFMVSYEFDESLIVSYAFEKSFIISYEFEKSIHYLGWVCMKCGVSWTDL